MTAVLQNCHALTYFGPREIRLCQGAGLGTGALPLTMLARTGLRDVAEVVRDCCPDRARVARHPQVARAPCCPRRPSRPCDGGRLPVDADGEYLGAF